MGIIRNALRKVIDHELGVLGEQLDRLQSRNQDLQLQLASYADRFDRFAAKAGMRALRQQRAELDPRDEFAALVQRAAGAGPAGEEDEFPDFESLSRRR